MATFDISADIAARTERIKKVHIMLSVIQLSVSPMPTFIRTGSLKETQMSGRLCYNRTPLFFAAQNCFTTAVGVHRRCKDSDDE